MKNEKKIPFQKISKAAQKNISGGLKAFCWCLTPIGLDLCMTVDYTKPCGSPGQFIVCRQEPCYAD